MQCRGPVDVIRHNRIRAPKHNTFAVFKNNIPIRRLRIACSYNIREYGSDRGSGIRIDARNITAAKTQQPSLKDAGRIYGTGRLPSVRLTKNSARAVLRINTFKFGGNQIKRFVPRNTNPFTLSAAKSYAYPFFKVTFAHHRITNPRRCIRQLRQSI